MPPMDHSMMTICMIASTLFALVILIAVIIQTVVQVKLLREVRKLHGTADALGHKDIYPRP